MQDYIVLGMIALAGVYYFFIRKEQENDEEIVEINKLDIQEGEGEGDAAAKVVNVTKGDVSNLVVPSNFPEKIDIYFGSQTGTAEKFAKVLDEEAADLGVNARVVDMEDFDKEELAKTELAIFVAATHGEGDPTDNALRMHTWLKKSAKGKQIDLLAGLQYTVFALGDTEYEKYCESGRFFDKKLGEVGGKRAFELGLGDSSNDLEGDFATWKTNLWPGLISHFQKQAPASSSNEPAIKRAKVSKIKYPLKVRDASENSVEHQIQPLCIKQYVQGKDVKIHSIRECRQTSKYGSCLEIIFDLEGTGLEYKTAANLAVFAENNEEDVDRICKRLNLDKDYKFEFCNVDGDDKDHKHPFPTPCTIGEALSKYCELRGPVDRKIFKDLSEYSKDNSEKEELLRLSQNDAKADIESMKHEYANIIDIIEQFKSLELPSEILLQLVPKMMPRYYTIASSSKLSPTKVRIAISLSEHESKKGKKFIGLISEYFKRIFESSFKNGTSCHATSRLFIKDSLFEFPEDSKTPLIMIGPGTGVVPFIAFSEERRYLKNQNADVELGPSILYFGCKEREHDYIYKDEISEFKDQGLLTTIHSAFSREQENKVYVQDLLKINSKETKELLMNQNAHVYICGAIDMGKSVESVLESIIGENGKDYLTEMKDNKRFAKELWAA